MVGEERSGHVPTRPTFELSLGMQLCAGTDLLIAPLNFCHTLVNNTAYHNNLLYLVTGDTGNLEKNHFHDVIGHQRLS